mmetsp:Transcript_11757/g.49527  ORF Transcript_11757/g.49527 Transcript_11757/m.49527 type:complete len:95 (+) Transcript_11757:254-538(+)
MKIPKGVLNVSVNARRLRGESARRRRNCQEELGAFLECIAMVEGGGRAGAPGRDNACMQAATRLLQCKALYGNYNPKSLPSINHALKMAKQKRS